MFSAFKRLAGKSDSGSSSHGSIPPGHQSMSSSLQRKFARGIQYNMKVVIKGDRNVGKTCLFHRLQGHKFVEEHLPTEEIQVTSIQWNYKATDDIVKVEVWDVVDRAKKKKCFDGLKFNNTDIEIAEVPSLDAEFLDVYKGTNGVIMMMDITKNWTFDYVQRELPKVPDHIPVMVLANHCDMSHHRTVTQNQILFFVDTFQNRATQIRYAESSMRNGFGLKLLHKFFNLPFLQLQRITLLQQLERNKSEMDLTTQELDMYFESDEADYSKFVDKLVNKRRQVADLNAPKVNTVPMEYIAEMKTNMNLTSDIKQSRSTGFLPKPIANDVPRRSSCHSISPTTANEISSNNFVPSEDNRIFNHSMSVSTNMTAKQSLDEQKLMSKITNSNSQNNKLHDPLDLTKLKTDPNLIKSVEEFCPDVGPLERSFLEDVPEKQEPHVMNNYETIESDSDGDIANPLVAQIQDYLDLEEDCSDESNVKRYLVKESTENVKSHSDTFASSHGSMHMGGQENDRGLKNVTTDEDRSYCDRCEGSCTPVCDNWMGTDCKWRRSPEGGEDTSNGHGDLDFQDASISDEDESRGRSLEINSELLTSSNYNNRFTTSDLASGDKKHHKTKRSDGKGEKKEKSKKNKERYVEKTSSKKDKKNDVKKKRTRDQPCDRRNEQQHSELEEFLNRPGSVTRDTSFDIF